MKKGISHARLTLYLSTNVQQVLVLWMQHVPWKASHSMLRSMVEFGLHSNRTKKTKSRDLFPPPPPPPPPPTRFTGDMRVTSFSEKPHE